MSPNEGGTTSESHAGTLWISARSDLRDKGVVAGPKGESMKNGLRRFLGEMRRYAQNTTHHL